jgi:hypothetical protein
MCKGELSDGACDLVFGVQPVQNAILFEIEQRKREPEPTYEDTEPRHESGPAADELQCREREWQKCEERVPSDSPVEGMVHRVEPPGRGDVLLIADWK